ncbi:hypothetical protein HDZ31DRAFT_60362 [Schizophyllum fasciatum]
MDPSLSSSSPSADRVLSECPPPRKRLRTVTPARYLPPDEIEREKAASLARLFDSWASLEQRYTRALDEDDILDLRELTVVKNRGVLAASPVKQFGMRQALLDDVDDEDDEGSECQEVPLGEQEEEDEDEAREPEESDDELDAFSPKRVTQQQEQPRHHQPLTEEEIEEFMRAERERRELEDEATDISSEPPYTSDVYSDASRPPDTDDDNLAPPSSSSAVESDDELDDWGLCSDANIAYPVSKGDESEGDLDAPSSPSPVFARPPGPRGRDQRPHPLQLYTPPRSQTSSSVPPFAATRLPFSTPCSDQSLDSPAYVPPSSPLPPSSPPASSSPLPSSPVRPRPRLTRPQSSPIRQSHRPPSLASASERAVTDNDHDEHAKDERDAQSSRLDADRTPAASKSKHWNTPQPTPIPRLDLSKMLSTKHRSRKSTSIFNTPSGTPSRQLASTPSKQPGGATSRQPPAADSSSPDHSPIRAHAPLSAKAKGKQRATELFTPTPPAFTPAPPLSTPTPPLSHDGSSSRNDSSSPYPESLPQRQVSSPVRAGAQVAQTPATATVAHAKPTVAHARPTATPAKPSATRMKKRKRQSSASDMSVDDPPNPIAGDLPGSSDVREGEVASISGRAHTKASTDSDKEGKAAKGRLREPTCYVEISVPPAHLRRGAKQTATADVPVTASKPKAGFAPSGTSDAKAGTAQGGQHSAATKHAAHSDKETTTTKQAEGARARTHATAPKASAHHPKPSHKASASPPKATASTPKPLRARAQSRARSASRAQTVNDEASQSSQASVTQAQTSVPPSTPRRRSRSRPGPESEKRVERTSSARPEPARNPEPARTPSVLPEPPPYAPPENAAGAPAQSFAPSQAYAASGSQPYQPPANQPYPPPGNQPYPYPPSAIDPAHAQYIVGQFMHHLSQLLVGGAPPPPQAGYPPGHQAGYPPGQQAGYPPGQPVYQPYPTGAPYATFPPYQAANSRQPSAAQGAGYPEASPASGSGAYSADESGSSAAESETSHRPTLVARSRSRGRRVSFAGKVAERDRSEGSDDSDGNDDERRADHGKGKNAEHRERSRSAARAAEGQASASSDEEPLYSTARGRQRATTIRGQTPGPEVGRRRR